MQGQAWASSKGGQGAPPLLGSVTTVRVRVRMTRTPQEAGHGLKSLQLETSQGTGQPGRKQFTVSVVSGHALPPNSGCRH